LREAAGFRGCGQAGRHLVCVEFTTGNELVTLERAYYELGRDRAALSMVEAFTFSLRRGVDELSRPDTLRRLSGFDADQLKDVCRRVQAFKPEIAMLWSPEGVAALITAWEHCQ
jgi:hypothetical protein